MIFRVFLSITLAVLTFTTMAYAGYQSRSAVGINQPELMEPDAEDSAWDYSLRTSFTGSNSTYRSWSQGGVDNISLLGSTGFSSEYKKEQFTFSKNINLRYGQSRIGDGDFVKSDDLIRVRTQIRRLFRDERFSTIFNLNFESQFAKGYDRLTTDSEQPRVMLSRFLAPAYINQILGLSYNPDEHIRFESGLAMKQTIVRDTTLSTRYGLEPGDTFRNEAGFSLLIGYERRIMESIYYSGYIETFTNVNKNLASSDLLFVNEITGQINRYISANVEFVLAYNDDVTDDLQIKQIISVGFNYIFFED